MTAEHGQVRRRWLAVALVLTCWLGAVGVAVAHPGGPPPHLQIHAEGRQLHAQLVLAADDAAALGSILGYLPESAMAAELGDPLAQAPSEAEVRAFSTSPRLRAYLDRNVQVRQDGRRCESTFVLPDDILQDRPQLRFTCPDVIEEVDVRLTLLHDLDATYRNFTVDRAANALIHTANAPEQRWDAREVDAGGVAWWPLVAALVGVLGAAIVLVTRRWWSWATPRGASRRVVRG